MTQDIRNDIGTDLYQRILDFDHEDKERADLMRRVWSVTPFVINCFTGNINSDRERSIRQWCEENIGPQAFPIHKREGDWQFGGATIHGWTWLGFARRELLESFLLAYPDAVREVET